MEKLSSLLNRLYTSIESLEDALEQSKNIADTFELSLYYKTEVIGAMNALRESADRLEEITSSAYWPYPSYGDMLFSIK